jgi:hypothetical protein
MVRAAPQYFTPSTLSTFDNSLVGAPHIQDS